MKNNNKARPLTEAEFLTKLNNRFGDKFELVGRSVNMNVRTSFKSSEGNIIECTPAELFRNN